MWFFRNKKKDINIVAPVDGEIISLDKVSDEVFSKKFLGDGFGIKPTGGDFISPIDGKLVSVFPTGHAYGIQHESGIQLLLHIGMDTVSLNGKGFDVKVKQNNFVRAGDLLCNVDLNFIKEKNLSLDTPVVFVPNSMKEHFIKIVKFGYVEQGDIIAIVKSE